ncbi:G-protein coupled receptor family C group 5 member B-like isoform X3 [Brienomyrus brachyistius]|uniref:G-protein coupled receptor family C group 5 member B-like isoform X3 n=1 Tax=Brienomyrus brachyistius TaxID=42636 RepID=UPI0020B2912F|nr:G-protein coupled receptor family C group 5 member B-like isoform X3 [Brienomyrus brachyistius]
MRMSIGEHRVLRAGEYDTLRQAMAFPSLFPILLIISLVGSGFAEEVASPQGCGSFLCNLDAVWGQAVTVVAGIAALASLILALVLLCRLRHITEPEARSGVAPLLLLLATVLMLCAVSFSYVMERDDSVCIARHSLWGALLVLTIAYQATQGVRLFQCSCFRPLAGVLIGLAVMQVIAIVEWILAIAVHPGQPVCQYEPLRFSLVCMYGLVLFIAVPFTLIWALARGQPQWRFRTLCLLLMSFTSLVVWVFYVLLYRFKKVIPGESSNWKDQLLAEVLMAQAWLLLLLHIAPEAHACLRRTPQPSGPHDVPEQAQPRPRGASLEEGIPLSPQPTVESQGSASYSSSGAHALHLHWNVSYLAYRDIKILRRTALLCWPWRYIARI